MKTEQFINEINALPTLEAKRAFYLNDMVAYFNSNTRCSDGSKCLYTQTRFSEGCAIGRRLPSELSIKLDNGIEDEDGFTVSSVFNTAVFKILPQWMQELGKDFLSGCQEFHDTICHWDDLGLSDEGTKQLKYLKGKYNLA